MKAAIKMWLAIGPLLFGLCPRAPSQIALQGTIALHGAPRLFGAGGFTNVKLYAVFPPGNALDRANHFAPYVMSQSAIDGVTVNIVWATVETAVPSATSTCTTGLPGTDLCQVDANGWYHNYDWTSTDSSLSYWFSGTWGTKAVNIIGVSQTAPIAPVNANTATPYYITTPAWIANNGGTQNYINKASTGACATWTGPTVTSITDTAGVATVTLGSGQVSMANGYPPTASLTSSDLVWIQGTGTLLDTGVGGAAIQSVTGTTTFTYNTSCTGTCSVGAVGTAITSVQSWLVPYQTPMMTGLQAFIAAAIKHFGPGGSGGTVVPSQVSYMRFGKSVGGESYVYCATSLPAGFTYLTWQTYITAMTKFEQAQAPSMLIFEPINLVGTNTPTNEAHYPNYEAGDAVTRTNARGATFGFGSQGLSLYDSVQFPLNPCASNWCALFLQYDSLGSPLELQQIANSDPTVSSCGTGGVNCTPTGTSADLRVWLPFAVTGQMNVLELYAVDADLAFDPNYCVLYMGNTACDPTTSYSSLNGLTTTQQFNFFQKVVGVTGSGVGLGYTGCSPASGQTQTAATGDCSYRDKINKAHGYNFNPPPP